MSIPGHAVKAEVEVLFGHCDPLMVAWHGRYFEYFEAGRMALQRSLDLDVPLLRKLGVQLFVVDTRCRFLVPARYGDRLEVTTWFSSLDTHLKISYLIDNPRTGRRLARAYTMMAATDFEGNLLAKVPDELRDRLPKDI